MFLIKIPVARSDFPHRLPDHVVGVGPPALLPGALTGPVGGQGTSEGLRSDGPHCQGSRLRNVNDQFPRRDLLQPHHCLDHLLHICRVHL